MLDLIIDDLGAQGDGIAHDNGTTVFVPGALPQERVRVQITETQGHQQRAELLDILTPSQDRIKPPCPHFPRCGGCRLQHIDGNAVTAWKVRQLRTLLDEAGFGGVAFLPPVVTAPSTRRRARLAAGHGKHGVVLGFNEWHSHHLVDLAACPVLMPELVSFVQALRLKLPSWLPEGKSCDIQITKLSDGLDVVLIGGPALGLDQRQSLAILAEDLNIAQLSWRKWDRSLVEPIAHRLPLSVSFGTTNVPFPPGSFLQATLTGEETLARFAVNVLGESRKIMDLFCGLGGFGLSVPHAKHIRFADMDGQALEALDRVARHNPRWHVEKRNLISDPYNAYELNAFDAVIFDPPRGGSKALAIQLAQSNVPTLVAVSCDPPSFVRDAKILAQGGYTLRALQPVDQFLWSTHLEIAAHFEKTA